MTIQTVTQTFGMERVPRFYEALRQCSYARTQELIPLLFFIYQENLRNCTLVDMASGTGYLADLLEPMVKKVIRVDRSAAMFSICKTDADLVYADLGEASHKLEGVGPIDIITCLAALHHICKMTDGDRVDPLASEEAQLKVLESWVKLLASGGKLLLIDVGVADLPFPADSKQSIGLLMKQYYASKHESFREKLFVLDTDFFTLADNRHPEYNLNWHIQRLLSHGANRISLASVFNSQRFRGQSVPEKTIPIDFFDHVVANASIDGHVAHFPRESHLRSALREFGLQNVLVTCLPTPWVFNSEAEAVWFVRELFGLGQEAVLTPADLIGQPDYDRVKNYINTYLGMYTEWGKVCINWQLMFVYGEKS